MFFKASGSRFEGPAKARFGGRNLALKIRIFEAAAAAGAAESARMADRGRPAREMICLRMLRAHGWVDVVYAFGPLPAGY